MGELASAIDLLAADDLPGLPAPALLERLAELLGESNRMAAEIARTVRACETVGAAEFDGLKNMPSWLRGHAHLSSRAAREVVDTGRALEHLPAVAVAFTDGQVTAAQAGLAAQVATGARPAQAAAANVDLTVIDAALAAVAVGEGHDQLVAVVRYYRDALDPDGPQPDPTEGRRFLRPPPGRYPRPVRAAGRHRRGEAAGRPGIPRPGRPVPGRHPHPSPPWPGCRGPTRACERWGQPGPSTAAPSSRT